MKKNYLLGLGFFAFSSLTVTSQIVKVDVNQTLSNGEWQLDINLDGIPDFALIVDEHLEPGGGAHFDIEFESMHSSAEIAMENVNVSGIDFPIAKMFGENENITSMDWLNNNHVYVALPEDGITGFAGQGDKFIGLRLQNNPSNYGWLKINVNADASSVNVISFGYNKSNSGNSINAGEFNNDVTNVKENSLVNTKVFSINNLLNIQLSDNIFTQAFIFDLNGKLVWSNNLSGLNNQFYLNLPKGIYIINLQNRHELFSSKFVY